MKKKLLFLFLFTCLLNGKTQPFTELKWSESIEPSSQQVQGLFGNKDLSFMVFTDRDHSFSNLCIAGVDASGKTMKVEYTLKDEAHSFIGAFAQKNQVLILLEFHREQNGQFLQEIKSFSFNTSGFVAEKNLLTNETKNKNHLGKIKFAVSPDCKRCVVFAESPFRTGANEEIRTIVLDEDGKEENKVFSLDIESKQIVHNYPQLSNAGIVYFLKRDKDKNQQFHYYLYAYNPLTTDLSHKAIALGNTNISDFRGAVTPQGEFLVGGFTSSENIHAYEGYFLMKFDQSCNQKFKTQGQFDETTFLKFLSKKEFSKDPVITDYYIDNIIASASGRIYLTAEGYSEKKVSEKETFYAYKDVMILQFNEAGEYKTTFNVPKIQHHLREAWLLWASYKTFTNNDTLVVLHNELNEKLDWPRLRQVKVHEKLDPAQPHNTYTFNQPEDSPYFYPSVLTQYDSNHFTAVFSTLDRKQFRIVKVTL